MALGFPSLQMSALPRCDNTGHHRQFALDNALSRSGSAYSQLAFVSQVLRRPCDRMLQRQPSASRYMLASVLNGIDFEWRRRHRDKELTCIGYALVSSNGKAVRPR